MSVHGAAYGVAFAFTPAVDIFGVPAGLDCRFGLKVPVTSWRGAPGPIADSTVEPLSRSANSTVAGALPSFLTVTFAVACSPMPTVFLIDPGLTLSRPAASAKSAFVAQLAATFTLFVTPV